MCKPCTNCAICNEYSTHFMKSECCVYIILTCWNPNTCGFLIHTQCAKQNRCLLYVAIEMWLARVIFYKEITWSPVVQLKLPASRWRQEISDSSDYNWSPGDGIQFTLKQMTILKGGFYGIIPHQCLLSPPLFKVHLPPPQNLMVFPNPELAITTT